MVPVSSACIKVDNVDFDFSYRIVDRRKVRRKGLGKLFLFGLSPTSFLLISFY